MKILGILNVTTDSFSDGGKYLAPQRAIAHGEALVKEGADIIDIGAASSQPHAGPVAPELEIARLAPLLPVFKSKGLSVSIDSFSTEVQRWAIGQDVDYLNDIHGFADESLYGELASSRARLIVMHAVQAQGVARFTPVAAQDIFDRITQFFSLRLAALAAAGIARSRLILDPGMGQFLGTDPRSSLLVLGRLGELKERFGLPILVSVSRKGFLRKIAGCRVEEAGAASLAAELFALAHGAEFVRTHAPKPLCDAVKILKQLGKEGFC